MEFGIEKCAMLIIKSGKRQMMEGIEVSNQERIKTLGEKEILHVLETIGSGHHQTNGDERKNEKRVSQTNEKTSRNQALQQESHQRDNKHVLHVRYWDPFLK